MSTATRTQVYLSTEQRTRVDAIAASEGVTMAEIVRRAVDRYVDEAAPDPSSALDATFGAAPGASAPDRDEWERG